MERNSRLRAPKNHILLRELRRVSTVLGIIFLALGFLNAAAPPEQPAQPSFTVDLRDYGYAAPAAARDVRALSFLHEAAAFLDEHTLAVSYFVENSHPDFTRRDGGPSGAVLFHTAFIDTGTRAVTEQRSWSNAGYWNCLLPLEGGRFLVQGNNHVSIYSRELRQLSTRRLVYPSDLLPRFAASPSGRALYGFQDWQDQDTHRWITKIAVLDAESLELKQSHTTPMHSYETVSDRQVVYKVDPRQMILESYSPQNSTRAMGVPRRDSEVGKLLRDSQCNTMAFVSNSVLAVGGGCPQLILFTDGGGLFPSPLLADLRFENRKVAGDFQPSRNGSRLAFALYPAKSRAKQEFEVDVYDLGERKIVFHSPALPAASLKFAMALSPDGSELGVLSDSNVQLWKLPRPH